MAQKEERCAKNGKIQQIFARGRELVRGDSVLLRGEESAVLYGCQRILFYGRTRICFALRKDKVSILGEGLICTAFSPMGVTVEGKVGGACYCFADCHQCPHRCKEELV